MTDEAGHYIRVVISAFRYLLKESQEGKAVDEVAVKRAAETFQILEGAWFDDERKGWLVKDLDLLVRDHWAVLTTRKNRGKLDEMIRGILR